ncbi:MAG: GntR family transcriptional regulator [Terracidiphilus sp.]|nr:GntR family transcriptional regulator [Terracidiphilus sp.]
MRDRTTQSPPLRRHVRDEIQRRILSGESLPGERLAQQSLAKKLGVGQGTVRESLLELEWLGLVDSIDGLGVFVGKLDASRLIEAYEVREYLEGLAARRACGRVSQSDLADLRAMADRIWGLSEEGDVEQMGAADRALHLQIVHLSRNGVLVRLAEGYTTLGMAVRASRDPREVYDEHLRIIDAISRNTPDEAEQLARLHVLKARVIIEQQAAGNAFIPKWVVNRRD